MSNTESEKEKESGTGNDIHKIFSTFYIIAIILLIPVVFCGLTFDAKDFAVSYVIDSMWVIGSIVISKILINKKRTKTGYLVLFSAPVVVFIYETLVWYANMGCKTLLC